MSRRPTARLVFRSISYAVPVPKSKTEYKHILKDITATLEPGTLTAIMGPSGCGKTVLLDILSNRMSRTGGTQSGQILLNGQVRDTTYWRRISAYVTQFDVLFPFLTVREMLEFSSQLRSNRQSNYKEEVDRVLKELDLIKCADTRIGDEFNKGISGGQCRRVTVGLELLANPILLFLDEPTTGLDSTSAKHLVETLKHLTQAKNMTVALTIHQPRSSTFNLIDRLLLLKGGEIAYNGLVNSLSSYLERELGMVVPRTVNLADFVVDLTYPVEEEDGKKDSVFDRLIPAWRAFQQREQQQQQHKGSDDIAHQSQDMLIRYIQSQSAHATSKYSLPKYRQVEILLVRSYLNASRNRGYHLALGLQHFQYLFYGLLFVGLRIYGGDASSVALEDLFKKNFLFQVMNTVCIVESVVIASAFLEKRLFYREFAGGSYSLISYHLAWYIRLTMDSIWKGLLAAVLCYFFPPMRMEAQAFFFFALVLMMVSSLGSSLGFCMACLVKDVEGASNIHNTIIGFMGTYAGFFLPSILIPIFTLWAYYLSFLKYSFEALELNEFGPCASYYMRSQFLSLDPTLNRWTNLLVLMAYPIIFHLLALLATAVMTNSVSFRSKDVAAPEEMKEGGDHNMNNSINNVDNATLQVV